MERRPVPKQEHSIFYGRVDALQPNDPPLGVEPAADNNVMKITADCLFMRTASGSLYGGRRSMSWWAAVASVFVGGAFFALEYLNYKSAVEKTGFNGDFLEFYSRYWYFSCGVALFVFVGCSWFFIPWRRQLPIIFNRKTNKITCFVDNQVVSEEWSSLEAYIKDVTTVAAGGAPINEGILTLTFHRWGLNGKQLRAVIMGTQDVPAAMTHRGIYGAAMVWEYIRLYMREGATAVPPIAPIAEYRLKHLSDPFRQFNPLKALGVKIWWYPIAVPFFLFVALPLAPVAIAGDLLYYVLDRILPRRKWPQELIDACDGVWDGREG
ncbi:hypothetical protein I5U64_08955 [Stenotrophomonas maltophilia]|nr:hypothetical protein [Stenotrophomonas maltophilia]